MFRIPLFLTFTKERVREFKTPPAPSRAFGQAKIKGGPNLAHDGPILCMAAEKDFVISGGVDGQIKLWRMESAPGSACARKYLGHKGAIWAMVIGSAMYDEEEIQVLISGSADRTIAIWNLFGAKGAPPIKTLTGHFGSISAICFVSWRKQVVSGSEDNTVRIWAMSTGLCETVLEGHSQAITCLLPWRGRVGDVTLSVVFSASREGNKNKFSKVLYIVA
jgi:WD40 repeat protein